MKQIKFGYDKETDNVDLIKGLSEELKDWVNTVALPFEPDYTSVKNFEFKSRSGFIAYDHNRGGVDYLAISTVAGIYSSGEHHGTAIESHIDSCWQDTEKLVLEADPTLEGEQLWDETYQNATGDYDQIAWRIRLKYEGQGVLLVLAGYDLDAPYFRGKGCFKFEKEIKFKTIKDLRNQLDKLTEEIEASQNENKKSA